jgi:DNA-binding SARP family transcriptional activator
MNTISINKVGVLCLFFILISVRCVYSQSFGLGFAGYEVHQEKRTGLDLSPGKTLCFSNNFEIAFDLNFRPNCTNYFGYILRVIENDHTNIDLVYTDIPDTAKNHKQFKLIVGGAYSKISFEIKLAPLFKQWNHIRLKFDFDAGKLILYSGSESYAQAMPLHRNSCYKFLFGVNNYRQFTTTDVPSMIIRDITIVDGTKLKYSWFLNEYGGTKANEEIKQENGLVKNPLWMHKMHRDWQLTQSLTLNGSANTAFDSQKENLYIIGNNAVLEDTILKNALTKFPYRETQHMVRGAESLYISPTFGLVNPDPDSARVNKFDFKELRWDVKLNRPRRFTEHYWHYNKFYSAIDTSLYIIGGYGHLQYKNDILRYHLPTKTWHKVTVQGASLLVPRYLSALGATKSGVYIMGGYGSVTGDQALNPRYFYDLLYFDVKSRSIKKVYELNLPASDFVFANSMVINEKEHTYYALIFDKNEYGSNLQLITGSLNRPGFKKVGSAIPYCFHDIKSFADLFYCPNAKQFVAVTTNYTEENDKTKVNVYVLNDPPVMDVQVAGLGIASSSHYFIYFLIVAGAAYALFMFFKKRRSRKENRVADDHTAKEVILPAINEAKPIADPDTKPINTIFLFGDLQLFDNAGGDVTRYFTPLIKELFLIIILYSIRWGRGINSEKLEEYLWADKTTENARNNRSANIARLKAILKNLDSCKISNETGNWKIEVDDRIVRIDYIQYLNIVKNRENLNKHEIAELAGIIKRGNFLSDVEFEWLDTFKSEIINEIINTYLQYAASVKIADDPEFLVLLSNYIFDVDPVNEEAMVIKCKALSHLGKHSLAKNTFEKFVKEYKSIYDENFKKDFHAIFEEQ